MGFLDDLKVNAQAAVRSAGAKANQLTEVGRLRLKIVGINRTLNEKYVQAGKWAYQEKTSGTPADTDALYAEITALRAQRRELETQLGHLKKVAICPECGAENPISAAHCMQCGASMK